MLDICLCVVTEVLYICNDLEDCGDILDDII